MVAGTYSNPFERNQMLTLAGTKMHLRVDHDDEDSLILGMMDTATAAAADYLNMAPAALVPAMPAPVKSAALLMVGDLYSNREAGGTLYGNSTYERLLNPYRVHA